MKRHQALLRSRSIQNQANILPTHQQPRYMQDIDYECFPKEVC